jgi:hypothetical protein
VRFQILTAAKYQDDCLLGYFAIRNAYYLHWRNDGGSEHSENVGKQLPDYTTQHPRRPPSSPQSSPETSTTTTKATRCHNTDHNRLLNVCQNLKPQISHGVHVPHTVLTKVTFSTMLHIKILHLKVLQN